MRPSKLTSHLRLRRLQPHGAHPENASQTSLPLTHSSQSGVLLPSALGRVCFQVDLARPKLPDHLTRRNPLPRLATVPCPDDFTNRQLIEIENLMILDSSAVVKLVQI